MIKKLKMQSGETLIEALVSLLIALLSISFLSTSVMTAANINQQTRAADEAYNHELKIAEGLLEEEGYEAVPTTVVIKFASEEEPKEVAVMLYGGEDSAFISYDYEP